MDHTAALSKAIFLPGRRRNPSKKLLTSQSSSGSEQTISISTPVLSNANAPTMAPAKLLTAKATFKFIGADPGDLPFQRGQIIVITKKISEDWFEGYVQGEPGKIGIFPETYVKLEPQAEPQVEPEQKKFTVQAKAVSIKPQRHVPQPTNASIPTKNAEMSKQEPMTHTQVEIPNPTITCIALYNFLTGVDGDLSFKKHDKLVILANVDSNWYMGHVLGNADTVGIFPSNYVSRGSDVVRQYAICS